MKEIDLEAGGSGIHTYIHTIHNLHTVHTTFVCPFTHSIPQSFPACHYHYSVCSVCVRVEHSELHDAVVPESLPGPRKESEQPRPSPHRCSSYLRPPQAPAAAAPAPAPAQRRFLLSLSRGDPDRWPLPLTEETGLSQPHPRSLSSQLHHSLDRTVETTF